MSRSVITLNNYIHNIKMQMPTLPNPRFEPVIELTSNREALIEGCHGIVEYNDCKATINCGAFLITIEGFDISLRSLSGDAFCVTGKFSAIAFTSV